MKNLLLTEKFIKFFNDYAEWADHKNGIWEFCKKIPGDYENYSDLIIYLDYLMEIFDWISIKKIVLPVTEGLEPDAWKVGTNFIDWKKYIINKYNNHKWDNDCISETLYIDYNCYYRSENMINPKLLFLEWEMAIYIYIVL